MALYPDKYSRHIHYPFEDSVVPSDLDDITRAVLDCRITLRSGDTLTGTGHTRPFGVMLTGAYTSSSVVHITLKAYDVARSIQWLFDCALDGEGIYSETFTCTYGDVSECLLIVDASALPVVSSPVTAQTLHLRTGHILLVPERITSITLINKSLDVEPTKRTTFATVATVLKNGTLDLRDGYNCRLKYDATTGTLSVLPGPGSGVGKYAEDPWTGTYPDVWDGVKTINGQNNGGDVYIAASKSLGSSSVKSGDGDLELTIGGANG